MRIIKGRLYVTYTVPGISGFEQWDKREVRIITGLRASSRDRARVVREFGSSETLPALVRIENGQLPEHQPVTTGFAAIAHLGANPMDAVMIGILDANEAHSQAHTGAI